MSFEIRAVAVSLALLAGCGSAAREEMVERFRSGSMTAEELLSSYATLVYSRERSYQAAGRRLGLDRRTVKAKVDPELLVRL